MRGEVFGSAAPVVGVDLDPLLEDPGGLSGFVFRNMRRDRRIRAGRVSVEAMEVLAALTQMARVELVTWGPGAIIRGKMRGVFPGRIRLFSDRATVAAFVTGRQRMPFYLTQDKTLAAMIPFSSGTEVVDPRSPSATFKDAIRIGREKHGR